MPIPLFGIPGAACKGYGLSLCLLSAFMLIALATPGFAQSFHFGVKGGVPMSDYFETGLFQTGRRAFTEYSAATRRYTVGATAELRLRHGLGVEVDALYKRMGYVTTDRCSCPPVLSVTAYDVKGHSWDFPIMAKFRFGRLVHPYVAGGATLRYIGPVRARGERTEENLITRTTTRTPIDTADPFELQDRFFPAVTVAGGVEFGLGRLRLLPEIRYTHWTNNISRAGRGLRLDPHQAEFLLGLLF